MPQNTKSAEQKVRPTSEQVVEYSQLREKQENDYLIDIKRKDWENRIQTRRWIASWILLILAGELFAVFSLVIGAMVLGMLKDLELVLSVITTATIGQSYYIVKFIIEFVFSEEKD